MANQCVQRRALRSESLSRQIQKDTDHLKQRRNTRNGRSASRLCGSNDRPNQTWHDPGFRPAPLIPGNRPGPYGFALESSLGRSCLGRPLLFPHWVKSSERSKACPMPAEELLLIVSPSQEMLSFISLNQLNRSNPVGHLRFD